MRGGKTQAKKAFLPKCLGAPRKGTAHDVCALCRKALSEGGNGGLRLLTAANRQ